MTWELADEAGTRGPYEDAEVITLLEGGLDPATVARRVGQEEWRSLRAHAPFAIAIERTARGRQVGSPAAPEVEALPADRRAPGKKALDPRLLVGGLIVVGAFGLFGIIRCASAVFGSPRASKAVRAPLPTPEPAPIPEKKAPSPLERIASAETYADALSIAKPLMEDTHNELSAGTILFAVWASKHWTHDMFVMPSAKYETLFDKFMKDSDEERGKRLCVPGSIVEIKSESLGSTKGDHGLMMLPEGRLAHFYSVASSEGIVEHSSARFCGVATGRWDYDNSGGGVGHALQMVGIFDIPQNKPKGKH